MPSVMGLLEERERAARQRVEVLQTELQEAEAMRERLVIARQTVAEVLADPRAGVKIGSGSVTSKPVYVAVGVDMDGRKDVLGLWVGAEGEGATTWMDVLSGLLRREVTTVAGRLPKPGVDRLHHVRGADESASLSAGGGQGRRPYRPGARTSGVP
ncbi:hypothetical protein GCM10010495_73720 [Kitasatospora herbaricolor]|nr:hypothetical protein [Kitasatospora herbaricolor]GGV45428.1 hypothetical protein GCM10010495_73720 [Kitasatospora herbaricolor]